jgi:hypothetical protein
MYAVIARSVVLVTLLAACGDPPARVHLVPVDLGGCGTPPRARASAMRVIAYARDGEHPDGINLDASGALSLADFPADTEQIGVEISGESGVIAAGKTAPLSFDSLADGASVPIAMLPLGGFCQTGPMQAPRIAPLVAHAGDGALVVGSADASAAAATAEYYDPATATFTAVVVPVDLGATGFAGATLTELADGKVLVTAPQHVALTFDPDKRTFTTGFFGEERALHSVAPLDADHVLVAGGCQGITGGMCDSPVASTFRYPLASLGDELTRTDGPTLGPATQAGAQLHDLGTQLDGTRAMVLAGSFTTPDTAERLDPDSVRIAEEISGFHGQVVSLEGGALLTALEPDGTTQTGAASVLPPGAPAVASIAFAPPLDGARLVVLEDGSVLLVGVDAMGLLGRYLPTTNLWQTITPVAAMDPATNASAPPAQVAQSSVLRLADGSVLVVGGHVAQPIASAWLFRPSLIGATSGTVVVEADGSAAGVLVPADPSTVTRATQKLILTAPGDALTARALVGGVRMTTGSVNAAVQVGSGGLALVAQQVAPGRALVGELVPGMPAQIVRLDGGTSTTLCTGQAVPALDPSMVTNVGFAVDASSATLSLAGAPLATCSLAQDADAADRGAWGIAADGANAQVAVVTITVAR